MKSLEENLEINIENINYSYNKKDFALKNLSLKVKKGEILGIIGNTGSGKSTLLKHLNAILKTDSGSVTIFNRKINSKSKKLKEIRRDVGVVFQFPEEQLFAQSIKEDLLFGPKNFNLEEGKVEERLREFHRLLGISDEILEKNHMELSGGEKRRASIASVVISNPKILVLDEPTIGLDYENKSKLLHMIKDLNESGITIVIVSHDLHTIWSILERVIILEKGQKIFDGDRINLLKRHNKLDTYFFPDYVEALHKLSLLKGNEEYALNKHDALRLIQLHYGGEKNE